MMYLSSGSDTKKDVEFDWHNYFFRDTHISTLIQCMYHYCYLRNCKLVQNMSNGYDYIQLVFVSTRSLTLEST